MASVPRSDDDVASTSGYSSGHSPPGLIRSGSSSPSDHTGSPVSSHPSSPRQSHLNVRDAHVYDDDWTYSSLHNETDAAKAGANDYGYHQYSHAKHSRRGEEASHLKRRRSGETLEKRHRHLADPSQTADVRKTGACVPCRVTKTKCHDHGVCPKCRQAFPDHSHLACQRMMPSHAYPIMSACPDIWSKHAREEAALGSGAHLFIGTPRTIAIFFSKEGRSSVLPATVQAYQSQRGEDASGLKTVSFPHQCVPDYRTLQAWVEGQMRLEHRVDFEHALQSFLLAYTEEGRGLPKHSFVSRVHEMNCFFKIWKTSKFWCRDPSHKVVALPLSVQAQLRRIAFVAIRSAEIDILKQLDDSLTQQAAMKPQEGMAMWASMWQLILIYRELLHSLRSSVDRYQRASKAEYSHLCDSLHKVSNIFFPLLTTFYHYQFRTKKNVEVSLDWLKASGYQVVREFAQQMLATRKEMLHKLQASKSSVDAHLCVFVVNHELKKLNARKRNPKSSSRSKHAFDDDCDDE